MRLLLIGTIGESKFVSNLGEEVEIKILDIKNNSVLFEVSTKPTARATKNLMDFEEGERIAKKVNDIAMQCGGAPDLAFLRKQAD